MYLSTPSSSFFIFIVRIVGGAPECDTILLKQKSHRLLSCNGHNDIDACFGDYFVKSISRRLYCAVSVFFGLCKLSCDVTLRSQSISIANRSPVLEFKTFAHGKFNNLIEGLLPFLPSYMTLCYGRFS
ncbi:Purine-cytosine permease FCY2 [Fusarium oxysporum f. sp. albedinis]|nr:Purine-cytosine permease FCY2 [Fusarium oxysporum f. sp. albedinis]